MATVTLTKSNVQALINNASSNLAGGRPSLIVNQGANFVGLAAFTYLAGGKINLGDALSGAALLALETKIGQMSYDMKDGHKKAYESWLRNMNQGNFQEIRIQPYNYSLVASGVYFTSDIPNVLAYKDSSGNWIEMS